MSLKDCKRAIRDFFEETYDIDDVDFSYEGDDCLRVISENRTFKGHDDDIRISIRVVEREFDKLTPYEVVLSFVFDELEPTLKNYELINEFNRKGPFFFGAILPEGYFKASWQFLASTPEIIVHDLQMGFNEILDMKDDDSPLKKITRRTD